MKPGELAGSLPAIVLEVCAIFLVALFDLLARGRYHLLTFGLLFVFLLLTLLSLFLYREKTRRNELEFVVDAAADRLSQHLTDILETSLIETWDRKHEDELCVSERKAEEIWVLTRTFASDLGCRKELILDNLQKKKKYCYLFAHEGEGCFDELLHSCDAVLEASSAAPELVGKCLHGRRLTPLEVVVLCRPKKEVYLYLERAPKDRRVLPVPLHPLGNDVAIAFKTLWDLLQPVKHIHIGHGRLAH